MSNTYEPIWSETLEKIRQSHHFPEDVFQTWICKTTLFKISDQIAYVCYPSMIIKTILEKPENKPLFEEALSSVWHEDVKIQFMDVKDMKKMAPEVSQRTPELVVESAKFNPSYTFENFIEGNSNKEAYAACLASCMQRKHLFNPIMIYGHSGLGKTHLLHAVGNYLAQNRPEAKVFYSYSGDLVTILLNAMKTKTVFGNKVEELKAKLCEYDYFLIDDIQNLSQSSSQEVFFTVYNDLIAKNAQIIITSDMHPTEISNLQTRLISRFTAGLTVNISKPEFDTAKAILKKKLEGSEETCLIQDDVIDYLASMYANDVRNLEGSLNRLIFSATIENPEVIDLNFAKHVLEAIPMIINVNNEEELTMKQIKKAVTRFYGLSYKDIEGKSRQKNIVNCRHVFVYLCREQLHKPYVAIGQELGNRDHTTIQSSYQRACLLLKKDEAFAMAIDKIKSILKV